MATCARRLGAVRVLRMVFVGNVAHLVIFVFSVRRGATFDTHLAYGLGAVHIFV